MRILYVEDNPANVSLVQRVARIGGHQVVTYTNGESALEFFDRDAPDLLLIDIQLAGELTGLDVVKSLRTRGKKLPVVALTAYAMVGDRERCLEAGCDGYLPKPLPITELVDLFQRYNVNAAPEKPVAAEAPAASTPAPPPEAKPETPPTPSASTPNVTPSATMPAPTSPTTPTPANPPAAAPPTSPTTSDVKPTDTTNHRTVSGENNGKHIP
ncbi:MAG: response regulator [Burkholderiales bacterium]|nr:response regulator [Anaerolineae bacterium]